MSELRREVRFRPAWDKRHPDPSKNYGIHGVELAFYVSGPEGAVQFVVYTNWMLPEVVAEQEGRACSRMFGKCSCTVLARPSAADVGYHRSTPRYESQPSQADCPWVPSGVCYYDGSGLHANQVFEILVREGDDAVWRYLESYYAEAVLDAGDPFGATA